MVLSISIMNDQSFVLQINLRSIERELNMAIYICVRDDGAPIATDDILPEKFTDEFRTPKFNDTFGTTWPQQQNRLLKKYCATGKGSVTKPIDKAGGPHGCAVLKIICD